RGWGARRRSSGGASRTTPRRDADREKRPRASPVLLGESFSKAHRTSETSAPRSPRRRPLPSQPSIERLISSARRATENRLRLSRAIAHYVRSDIGRSPSEAVIPSEARDLFLTRGTGEIPRRSAPRNDKRGSILPFRASHRLSGDHPRPNQGMLRATTPM